jgi:hypothetical protein
MAKSVSSSTNNSTGVARDISSPYGEVKITHGKDMGKESDIYLSPQSSSQTLSSTSPSKASLISWWKGFKNKPSDKRPESDNKGRVF